MPTATALPPVTRQAPISQPYLPGQLYGSYDFIRDPLGHLERDRQRLGDIYQMRFMKERLMAFYVPEGPQRVLQENHRNYDKGVRYLELKLLLGEGLLTAEGEHWLRQRRLAQPAFHRKRMAHLLSLMGESVHANRSRWTSLAEQKRPLEASFEMMRLTLDVVSKAILGSSKGVSAEVVSRAFGVCNKYIEERSVWPVKPPPSWPIPWNKKFWAAAKELDDIVYQVIEEKRQNPDPEAGDLISMLMAATDEETGEQMNDKQLRDEVMTILLAGHETSANALSWALYLMGTHPEVLQRAKEEVRAQYDPSQVDMQNLLGLSYLRQVLDETMRLYPPAWILSRTAVGDDVIAGYEIQKGTDVLIPIYHLHRNPNLWERAEAFDPERFAPGKEAERHKYQYIPFGGGPRLCIGQNFAVTEMLLILADLLYHFELTPKSTQAIRPIPLITLKPAEKILFKLEKRTIS